MDHFESYNRILISAFASSYKQKEFFSRKSQLVKEVCDYNQVSPKSQLVVGFNPLLVNTIGIATYVYGINSDDFVYLKNINSNLIRLDSLESLHDKVDVIISGDEFFTFFVSEDHQRTFLENSKKIVNHLFITSLRDYKNQDFKDKEFSFPAVLDHNGPKIYLEYHNHDSRPKNSWSTNIYEINGSNMILHGPFERRAVFFKQLAKFANDAGFSNFTVHKNLMYKSIIRKNYEHVISFS